MRIVMDESDEMVEHLLGGHVEPTKRQFMLKDSRETFRVWDVFRTPHVIRFVLLAALPLH